MEKPLEEAQAGLGWSEVSENHQGESNSISKINGELIFDVCLQL